jgi:hypothetical protein
MKHTILMLMMTSMFFAQNPFFDALKGEWDIKANMFMNRDGQTRTIPFQGKADWEPIYNGRYIKGIFKFTMRGRTFKGESFIGKSERSPKFEFVQIDDSYPRMFVLSRYWNEEKHMLELTSSGDGMKMKWEFEIGTDGQVIERLLIPNSAGEFYVQSEYIYERRK